MKYIVFAIMLLFTTPSMAQHHHHGHEHDDDDEHCHEHDGTLPVDLLSFKAIALHNAIKLTWTTATESDNDYFTLFRSPNGFEYLELVGKVNGAGTSNIPITYTYIDDNPSNGINYYVLTQTDYNGDRKQYDPIGIEYVMPPEIDIWEYYNILGQEIK